VFANFGIGDTSVRLPVRCDGGRRGVTPS
jgi:hypothetical protein